MCTNNIPQAVQSCMEPSLEQLTAQGPPALREYLLATLSALQSPDDLFTFFGGLRALLAEGRAKEGGAPHNSISHSSALGLYARRALLAFDTLSFDGVCRLHLSVQGYTRAAGGGADPS